VIRHYLLDTGIAQDFQDDRRGVRDKAKAVRRLGHRVGICMPVLGELWSGVEGSAQREANVKQLRHALKKLSLWPYSAAAAAEYGRIFVELKRAGRPIQQIDSRLGPSLERCPIASLCRRMPTFRRFQASPSRIGRRETLWIRRTRALAGLWLSGKSWLAERRRPEPSHEPVKRRTDGTHYHPSQRDRLCRLLTASHSAIGNHCHP
jgi:tRNA(fMet)-specific endonuclease VapC